MLLAYTDRGGGPVVVLLHGFPLNRTMWKFQVEELSHTYRVIAPDLRGHGESPAPDVPYSMEQMAEDVVELLDGLGLTEPVVVGGLSMGGYVALAMALKHAARVRGLMLVDTRAAADSPEAAAGREATAVSVLKAGHAGSLVETMVPRLFARSTFAANPSLVPPIQAMIEATSAAGVAGTLRGMAARPDVRGRLPEIAAPTLVAVGEEDVITPPDEARSMAEALPRGRLAIIPRAGHLSPYENPSAFNATALDFLKDAHAHA